MTAARGPVTAAEYRDQVARAMSEDALTARVRELAALFGWRRYHTHDSRRSPAGFPDEVLVHARARRLVFAELKRHTGRVRPEQRAWLDDLGALAELGPVEVYLWRPADYLDGSIERALRVDTPHTGLALPPRNR